MRKFTGTIVLPKQVVYETFLANNTLYFKLLIKRFQHHPT